MHPGFKFATPFRKAPKRDDSSDFGKNRSLPPSPPYTCHRVVRTCQIHQAFDTEVIVFNVLRNVHEFGGYLYR